MFAFFLTTIILGTQLNTLGAILFLPFQKPSPSASSKLQWREEEQQTASGNDLFSRHVKHKSNYPLHKPTTKFEEAYLLKLIDDEFEGERRNHQILRDRAQRNHQISLMGLFGLSLAVAAGILGLSLINFGAGTDKTVQNISTTFDSFVRSFDDFLNICRSFTFRRFLFGGSKKQSAI